MSIYNNYRDILQTALETFWAIGNLEPLPQDAPASDLERFEKALDGLRQILGETTSLLVGISSNVVDEEGYHPILSDGREELDLPLFVEDEEEPRASPSPTPRRSRQASGVTRQANQSRKRARRRRHRANEGILPTQSPQPEPDDIVSRNINLIFEKATPDVFVKLEDFVVLVLHGYAGSHVEQEVQVLQYALMGYPSIRRNELKSAFHFYHRELSDSTDTVSTLMGLDDFADQKEKLLARESLLISGPTSNVVACYVHKVIYNIESIEAVRTWDELSNEEKNDFRYRMAPIADPVEFGKLEENQDLSEEYKAMATVSLVKKFTNRHNKIMQRRRYFWSLYQQCGPSILLDPYLLSLSQSEYPTSSKFLDKIVNGVLNRIEDVEWGLEKYWDNRQFLLAVVRFLGGYTVYQYVKLYLNANIPWAVVGRDSDEDGEDWGDETEIEGD